MMIPSRLRLGWLLLGVVLVALALVRPIDHDESQYVAAAVLTAHGLLPYRDFAYLQTPLQPFAFAPVAALAGWLAWPALRIVNALLGWATVALVYGAARESARSRLAAAAAALFATCDILLFSVGTARNDALPAALFAGAIWLVVRQERKPTQRVAATIGLLLASAAAAKISYAIPAAAYGLWTLRHRRLHPVWVAAGTLPALALVGWTYALSPAGFVFGTLTFPALAPSQFYADHPWKLSWAAKAIDTLKFLALGAALLGIGIMARPRRLTVLDWLCVAGLIAALLPVPTWRQYLLPLLPPLFVRLAQIWAEHPPARATRIAAVVFACAGLAPSVDAAIRAPAGVPIVQAIRDARSAGQVLDAARINGPVATLSPQFLPATGRSPDPRFATGPFYFRSQGLVPADAERSLRLVSKAMLPVAAPPPAILVGGKTPASGRDPQLDQAMERWAIRLGYQRYDVGDGRLRLYIRRR